jgi:hypothetical protein
MITGKNILFLCKESFSFPIYFAAELFNKSENNVGALFVNPIESYYNKSEFNGNTYYKFKEQLPDIKLYGLEELCKQFNVASSQPMDDYSYLNYIENKYTFYKNLNMQLISSQLASRQYHTRFYFKRAKYSQGDKYLELGYKRVIEIVDEFKPDMILDLDDSELIRTIVNEVAHERHIPYININYPRYEDYKIPTYCMGLKVDSYFKKEYFKFYAKNTKELVNEYSYVRKYRSQNKIMSQEFRGTITNQYTPNSLYKVAKYLFSKGIYFWRHSIISGNFKKAKNNILYDNSFLHFLFYCLVEIKKQYLYRKNIYFCLPKEDDLYIYMPLHLIPESTTLVKAPFYINELSIIEQVSKSLPIGWKLYVKEHQSMLGERDFKFYKRIHAFPNVRLVQFNYYDDPKPWIINSIGVITITGTSAYEAAMLGKSAIVFGDVPFMLIDGIIKVNSYEELPSLLKAFTKQDNIHSCAAYIAAVQSNGIILNIKKLMSEGESILKGEKNISSNYLKRIKELCEFYEKAYNEYKYNQG